MRTTQHTAKSPSAAGFLAAFSSPSAKGTPAPAARRLALPLTVFAAALLALVFAAAPASAAQGREFIGTFGSTAQPSFAKAEGLAVDPSTGDVLVIDKTANAISRYHADGTPAEFSALGTNVIDGKGPGGDETPQNGFSFGTSTEVQIAVAPPAAAAGTAGDIYVTQSESHLIDIFAPDGHYLGQLTKSGATNFGEACGVAVDSSGAVYVGDFTNNKVHKFVPSANPPLDTDNTANFSFAPGQPCTLAAGTGPSSGSIFVAKYLLNPGGGGVSKLDSSTGEEKYVVSPVGNTTVAVDASGGDLLLAKGSEVNDYDVSGASGAALRWHESFASAVEGIAADGNLYLSRSGASQLEEFGPFELLPPRIEAEWSAGVLFAEATLKAQFPPEEEETTYHLEYSTTTDFTNCGLPANPDCHKSPDENLGSAATVSVALSDLEPGTTYHYRFLATNPTGTTEGDDHVFTTYRPSAPEVNCPNQAFRTGPSAALPDCRAYEMVSPVNKNGGDIINEPGAINEHDAYIQASPDGERITYSAAAVFAGQASSKYFNQYLSGRGTGSWTTQGINAPFGEPAGGATVLTEREVKAFSPDLCSMWFDDYNANPLDAEGQPGIPNIYRRQNCSPEVGGFEALITTFPSSGGDPEWVFHKSVQGISDDGAEAFFVAAGALTPDAAASERGQVYLHRAGDPEPRLPHLVSILPTGVADSPPAGTQDELGGAFHGEGNLHNAVSADGRRAFWTAHNSQSGGEIYLRENPGAAETAAKDGEGNCVPDPVLACTIAVSSANAATFWDASKDGAAALYSEGELGSGAASLYRFDVASRTRTKLAEGVMGVLGSSDDLARIYLASTKALTPGQANSEGDEAIEGRPNLYLAEGGALTFIASLLNNDGSGGGTFIVGSAYDRSPRLHASRVTPDGRHIAFESRAPLTGFDNTDTDNGEADLEVFAYEADGELLCVSCNPAGARPAGQELPPPYVYPRMVKVRPDLKTGVWAAAWIPTWEHPLHASNVLSGDGRRVFFHSSDALLPRDTNGAQDVYEWEAPGAGGCDVGGADYFAQNGGCLSLISSGTSPEEAEFWDASTDGRDVFFTTSSSLLPQDPGLVDLYDARALGGFSQPTEAAACEGEACQSPPAPPDDATPASSAFEGAGNVVEKPARKPHKKHHRKKHHKRHQRRANPNRRAAR